MTSTATTAASNVPDVRQILIGYWSSQLLYVAAKLEIADRLAAGPSTAAELAAATGTDSDALYRVLRALAGVGIFAQTVDDKFSLNAAAEPLRGDAPDSQRAMAVMMGEEHYRCWGELLYSVRTGRPAFEKIFGQPVFDFLGAHPEQGAIFDAAMSSVHGRESAAMVESYDFGRFATLADVGGGNGSVLTALLKKHARLNGILFDLPAVVERALPKLAAAGVAERCRAVGGDFFASVVAGADAYLLRHIIHDWTDAQSLSILRNIRQVIPGDGRLLLVETVIRPGSEQPFGKLLDVNMLLIPGGRERTAEQYQALYEAAGFRLSSITPTSANVDIIEGCPQ